MDSPTGTSLPVKFRITERVALLWLSDPPTNSLVSPVRRALAQRLDDIAGRRGIEAVLLMAEGPGFSDGTQAAVTEDGTEDAPTLADLCERIENWPVPVVAILQGAALGSGAELALACHMRLATPTARFGFPDITLGLPPSGGASQRLPRLAGVDIALRMLLTGRPVAGPTAQQFGLVDGLIEGDPQSGGLAAVKKLVSEGASPVPAGQRREKLTDGVPAMRALAKAREALGPRPLHAARRIADCVEAALLLPFETGLEFEADAHDECRAHSEARAMRSLYLAERRVSPDLLVADEDGRRRPRPAGQAVIARLAAAQQRAIDWLRANGVTETTIDQAFLARGFARGPIGAGAGGGDGADEEVWLRIAGALLAEGGRLVEEGAVRRAGDVDALAVHGMGWPRRLGGPMIHAQNGGLTGRLRHLRNWRDDDPVWTASAPLAEAAKTAAGFPI